MKAYKGYKTMPYSLDLRKKVINYIECGGKITEASKIFKIGRATVYRWLNRKELAATQVKHRHRKIDKKALEKDVLENPDSKLVERAQKFGVHPSAIFSALKKLKITRKKKNCVTLKEIEKPGSNTIKNCES